MIDAGHGGHDTGTIGPHGLMEKDLCLDVALRLGALIEQKLPGADVVYTRNDDTFVPLEERTAIANRAQADLFISIHANSSHDGSARGVETYYLNFATTEESMEVASRENALSQESLHDLQDLIKKIARNDKIEESKELASDVQDSLTQRLQLVSHSERNRGVKKAPFVVLIGANMPSILSEISFVSNPARRKAPAQGRPAPAHRRRAVPRHQLLSGKPQQPLEQQAEARLRQSRRARNSGVKREPQVDIPASNVEKIGRADLRRLIRSSASRVRIF